MGGRGGCRSADLTQTTTLILASQLFGEDEGVTALRIVTTPCCNTLMMETYPTDVSTQFGISLP